MNIRRLTPFLSGIAVAVGLCSGCSTEQMYGSLQSWHRTQSSTVPGLPDAERCASSAPATYDAYRRDAEGGGR